MIKINTIYLICAYTLILAFLFCLFLFPDVQINVFLEQCNSFMADFFNHIYFVKDLNPYGFENSEKTLYIWDKIYSPLVYVFFYYFAKICPYTDIVQNLRSYPQIALALSTCFFSVCTFVLFYILDKASEFKNKFWVLLSLVMSGLYLFTVERGNLIILTVIFISLFFLKDKLKINETLAAFFLALAAAFKFTPILLSLLYLYKKDYKNFFKFLIFFVLLFFIPFLFIKGQFQNIFILIENLNETKITYTYFSLIDLVFNFKAGVIFVSSAILISCIALVFNCKVKCEFEKVTGLVLSLYFLFTNNYLYVLLMLFPCFIMFLNKKNHTKIDYIYLVCFLVIFNPLQIMINDCCINRTLIRVFAFIFLFVLTSNNLVNMYQNHNKVNIKS